MKRPLGQRIRSALSVLLGQSSAYSGADYNRLLSDWLSSRMPTDDEWRVSAETLRARARDLERNDPLSRAYLRALAINVVGPKGIRLQAQVRDNSGRLNIALNERIEDAWDSWCHSPTLDGRHDFNTFSRMLLRTVARDGEAFVRLWRGFPGNPFRFALEFVDPDLVDHTLNQNAEQSGTGNEVRLGIEVDPYSRPVAYYAWDRQLGSVMNRPARKRLRIPADEVIHLYDPDRGNQTRGVTWLASVMLPTKMLLGYVEAELVGSRVAASKMALFQRKEGGGGGLSESEFPITTEANPGSFGFVPEGYEVAQWSPDHPAGAFGSFVKAAQRNIAMGLGISYNGLTSDLESVNYSSMRSGLLIERDVWRTLQGWWVEAFLRRVYPEWLNLALLSGQLRLDSRDFRKFLTVRWNPRGWAWVDPLKDSQAGVLAIHNGLASRQDLLAEQGLDVEDVFEQLAEERDLAEQYGIELAPPSQSPPVPVAKGDSSESGGDGEGDNGSTDDSVGKSKASANGNGNSNRLRALLRGRR